MNRIEFKKTNHTFLDNGIIALHRYLQKYADTEGVVIDLQPDKLVVESVDLPQLLETVYYEMGRDVYDTYTAKQENEAGNLYYIEAEDRFETFPKMNTYGFTELLTNNAQGTTSKEENFFTLDNIKSEEEKANKLDLNKPKNLEKKEKMLKWVEEKKIIAQKTEEEFKKRGLTLLSKMYINEPYTKITRLIPFNQDYVEEGNKFCYLTGEKFKRLVDSQSTSPFISGLVNFNSHIDIEDKKMSWKALYLSRFAAANCLYVYQYNNKNKKNSLYGDIIVYFLGARTLTDLTKLYDKYLKDIRIPKDILKVDIEFRRNFNLYNFGKEKAADIFIGKNEHLFMVLYTLFERITRHLEPKKELSEYADLLGEVLSDSDFNVLNPNITSFRANAFSGGNKRPNNFEVFTHLRYALQLFRYFETEKLDMLEVLWSLKIIKPTLKKGSGDWNKITILERQSRDRILGLLLRGQSIISEIEDIFYDCYRYLLDKGDKKVWEVIGTKNFYQLVHLVKLYEPKINPLMEKEKKERTWEESTIDLGYSFGKRIIESGIEEGKIDRVSNARKGRKYIIGVRKSRTYDDFLEGFNRIVERFKPKFDYDVLAKVNESNYRTFKSYFTLGLLSAVNQFLSSSNNSTI
ncbi:MAG: hypothetical protein JNL70_26255 [Saprospiraceae bacterium]|nr:hypothetical protein [Saprospiraceae bacterium]